MSKLSDWSTGVLDPCLNARWKNGVGCYVGCQGIYLYTLAGNGRFESKLAHIMNIFYAIVDYMMLCVI